MALSSVCVAMGALAGVFTAFNSIRIQNLQAAFDDLSAALTRRAMVVRTLCEILGPDLGRLQSQPISEERLEDAVAEWLVRPVLAEPSEGSRAEETPLKRSARRIRGSAFTGVLIAKAKEAEIFREQEALDDDGALQAYYRVEVTPRTQPAPDLENS